MLAPNGCPNNFLDRCIQQFLNRKHGVTQQRDSPPERSPSPKYISLQLPYLGSVSNNIRQELSSFIRHRTVVNVKLHCFQNTRKLQSWYSIKDWQALHNCYDVVYRLKLYAHGMCPLRFSGACVWFCDVTSFFNAPGMVCLRVETVSILTHQPHCPGFGKERWYDVLVDIFLYWGKEKDAERPQNNC